MPQARAGEHDQQRAQALAAAGDDVLGDLVDQRHGTLEARADDRVDGVEVGLDQGADVIQGHGRPAFAAKGEAS